MSPVSFVASPVSALPICFTICSWVMSNLFLNTSSELFSKFSNFYFFFLPTMLCSDSWQYIWVLKMVLSFFFCKFMVCAHAHVCVCDRGVCTSLGAIAIETRDRFPGARPRLLWAAQCGRWELEPSARAVNTHNHWAISQAKWMCVLDPVITAALCVW